MEIPTGGKARDSLSTMKATDPVRLRGQQLQSGWKNYCTQAMSALFLRVPEEEFFYSLQLVKCFAGPWYEGLFLLDKDGMQENTDKDFKYMMRAIELADRGGKHVGENPKVGCVIVHEDRIIGAGCHEKYGGPHAEVNAVESVAPEDKKLLDDATYYVTLEPCSHYGKTPPCADMISKTGAKEVVIASLDSNPRVAGRGVEILLNAGIDVRTGIAEEEARRINKEFFSRMEAERSLPAVMLKMGMTLDGYIATRTGQSKWITGKASRQEVQRLRGMSDAIVTGMGTVIADDPLLTYRGYGDEQDAEECMAKSPVRIILDSHLKTPIDSKILNTPPKTVIYSLMDAENKNFGKDVSIIRAPKRNGRIDLHFVINHLSRQGMQTIMIEAGSRLATAFLREGLVSDIHLFIAPKLIGGDGIPAFGKLGVEEIKDVVEFESLDVERIEEDIYVHGNCRRDRKG